MRALYLQQCYKLRSRVDHYARLLKPKRLEDASDMQKLRLRQQHEETQRALSRALLNWDKTRTAVGWLKRDFELCYAALLCHGTLHRLLHAREDIKGRLGPSTLGSGSTRTCPPCDAPL